MMIRTVEYRKLVSTGNYENEVIGATAFVGPGESADGVLDELVAWVDSKHAESESRRTERHEFEMRCDISNRQLVDVERNLAVAEERWEKAKAFLAKHGVDVEDIGIPF